MTAYPAARSIRPSGSTRRTGWAPFALVALAAVPAIAGSLRLLATNDRIAPAEKSQAQLGNVLHDVADVSFTVLSGTDEADGNRSAHRLSRQAGHARL